MRDGLRALKIQKIIKFLFQKYAKNFFVRIDQITIQHDHIHVIVRSPRRFYFQSFFEVIAGQIAHVFQKQGLLKSDEEQIKLNQGMTGTPKGTAFLAAFPNLSKKNDATAIGHINFRSELDH